MGVIAVVGILIATLYHPIWASSIFTSIDFAFSAVLFSMLLFWKLATLGTIVLSGAIGGFLLSLI
jgi:chromate transporter